MDTSLLMPAIIFFTTVGGLIVQAVTIKNKVLEVEKRLDKAETKLESFGEKLDQLLQKVTELTVLVKLTTKLKDNKDDNDK